MDDLERLRRFVTRDEDTRLTLDTMSLCWVGPEGRDPWVDCPPPPGRRRAVRRHRIGERALPDARRCGGPLRPARGHAVRRRRRQDPEWLALATQHGFVLDGLAYDWDSELAELQGPPWRAELDEPERRLLDELTAELDLRPWPDVPARLAELQRRLT
ncbi:hypothetical protein [Nocardioides sp. TF02-7]|uniref:hypothetical protein n=1 Tax=Nocardioides sp. TF02-7 TaxID=2917724 RepID=UPI001F061C3B|nr:hypothetical protein [Nocardioides sp. TF02-7]UMG93122.1 hypothetical protein MF408_01995 [Nocardioides sp. TF02-7]